MKKLFLLFTIGSAAISLNAQELQTRSLVFNQQAIVNQNAQALPKSSDFRIVPVSTNGLLKSSERTTTGGGSRWYSYIDNLEGETGPMVTILGSTNIQYSIWSIWNDTTAKFGYIPTGGSATYYYNTWTSIGESFDPFAPAYNDSTAYTSTATTKYIKVASTNAYTIDSVGILGSYMRNNAKPLVVDTLRLSFVTGNGTRTGSDLGIGYWGCAATATTSFPLTPYGVDTLRVLDIKYDSIHNRADSSNGGSVPVIVNILLHATDTASLWAKNIAVSIPCAPGFLPAMSVSFISGDAAFHAGDTVQRADGSYKYGIFSPIIGYHGTSTGASWAQYSAADYNCGYWKDNSYRNWSAGGRSQYSPLWSWSSTNSSGASVAYPAQYLDMAWHVNCGTCAYTNIVVNAVPVVNSTINSVKAFPNPASNEVRVSYTFNQNTDATFTLTNIIGQEVASQNLNNVINGTTTFNTTNLAGGVYMYTVKANGETTTGRVVIAH